MDTEHPERWVHEFPVRVQFDEVDQYGIVHHARYWIYCERARVELMGVLGMRADSLDGDLLGLVVVEATVQYKTPSRFLDELIVEQGCRRIGASRTVLCYRIRRGSTVIANAEMVLAFVDGTGRPVRAPTLLRDGLQRMGIPGVSA
jgi:acyl-CoA thioester hydrolase